MDRRTSGSFARTVALAGLLIGAAPVAALARQATPTAPSGGITLAAGGLLNPRGFTWDADGTLFVALAGDGGPAVSTSTSASPEDLVEGPTTSGTTASVVRIEDGCGVAVAEGLPSTRDPYGDVQGPVDVDFLDGQIYVLQDATGGFAAVGPDFPNGLYAVDPDGSVRLVSDVTAWVRAKPAANLYHVLELGEPFAMAAGDDEFWVVDANQGELLRITLDGNIAQVADLSLGHPVPTAIALAPDGGIYVGFLTPGPHVDGSSKVVKVTPDGVVSDYWTGLTTVTGLAVAADGTLYALEMATGNSADPPNIFPNTGKVVRQTGPSSMDEVATGLDFPISMGFGPDGGLYVSLPAIATDGEPGGIIRLDPTAAEPLTVPDGLLAGSPCSFAAPVSAASPAASIASPAPPTPDATTPPVASPGAGTPAAVGDKSGIASLAVQIQGFAFNPPTLTIPAGGIVAWTNLDPTAHTATAPGGEFDSGNLDPGAGFSHAFEQAGSFDYRCNYHPMMRGTIVVE